MRRKLFWVVMVLFMVFLFRDRLLEMAPWQQEGISVPAILAALIGGSLAFLVAYDGSQCSYGSGRSSGRDR